MQNSSKINPLIAVLCLSPGLVFANNLNQIVVSANQIEQSLELVTADVTVISAHELQTKRATSLIELLNQVGGLSFTQNGGLGTSTSLFMRGSDTDRTLILIDGVRAQDPSNTSGANLSDLMMSNIERIEIIKGAQSGVWGADAAAGVINIITKQSTDTNITVEHGAYKTGKSAISTGLKLGDARFFVNASHLTTESFSAQAPVNENIDQYEKDGYTYSNLALRAVVPMARNQQLTLAHNATDALANYDGWGAPDAIKRSKNRADLSQLIYQVADTKLSAEQSVFSRKQLDEGTPDIVRGQTRTVQLTQQINTLLLGAAYSENQASSDKYSWVASDNVLLEKQTYTRSVFATHSTRWRYLIFNEALRYDEYSNFGSELTGKFGIRLDITPQQSLAFNYGTAYNAPNIMQILNPWGTSNPDLTPEKSTESSVTYTLYGLTLSYFDKKISDLIDWNLTSSQYQNTDGTTSLKGVEVAYNVEFKHGQIRANYSHLTTKDANGDPLLRRPENQLGLDLNWYANDKLDLNLNAQYIATRSGNVNEITEHYNVWNGVINYQIDKSVSAYLKVNNLLNRYYQVVEGYAAAERSAYLGLNATF